MRLRFANSNVAAFLIIVRAGRGVITKLGYGLKNSNFERKKLIRGGEGIAETLGLRRRSPIRGPVVSVRVLFENRQIGVPSFRNVAVYDWGGILFDQNCTFFLSTDSLFVRNRVFPFSVALKFLIFKRVHGGKLFF